MYNFAGNSSARSRPVMRYLYAVHGQSAENVYAVGSGGKTVHYDGKKWKELPSPVTTTLSGVWTAGSGEVFAVGAEGVILHYNP
ncbi:MAG: hypothetical protein NTW07_03855, partial [candidate division Zixibacteria bacterium]|nr:hypothetical protein [candidate division Zixibacteria bacterium]